MFGLLPYHREPQLHMNGDQHAYKTLPELTINFLCYRQPEILSKQCFYEYLHY